MAGRPRVVHRPLGHEGCRATFLRSYLLDPVLEHEVTVGRLERPGVGDVDLVLPPTGLALGELYGEARAEHLVPDPPQDVLLARRLQQLVVLDRQRMRREILPRRGGGLLVRVSEQEEFELGGDVDQEAALCGAVELVAQHLAWRHLDRLACLVAEVGDDERRPRQPRDPHRRLVVRPADHVAVAGVPVGEPVSGHWRHVDVDGQQVLARLNPVVGHVGGEEVRGHPLAHRSSVHVGERNDDRVDGAVRDPLVNQCTACRGHAPCCPRPRGTVQPLCTLTT